MLFKDASTKARQLSYVYQLLVEPPENRESVKPVVDDVVDTVIVAPETEVYTAVEVVATSEVKIGMLTMLTPARPSKSL